jgi:Rad3-related DNA helicase
VNRDELPILNVNPLLTGLPFDRLRPAQADAVLRALRAYEDGAKLVIIDAPTGSGKTLIAEVIRRMLRVRGTFVCSGKDLQRQFADDFNAPILMGRDNYLPTALAEWQRDLTCQDCLGQDCGLCHDREECPYEVAKAEADAAPIAALNAHYWLNSVKTRKSPWYMRGLTIIDECDTLESVLMSMAEVYISDYSARQWKIEPPRRMTWDSAMKDGAWVEWCLHARNRLRVQAQKLRASEVLTHKQLRALNRIRGLQGAIAAMQMDCEKGEDPWVYTGGAGSEKRNGAQIAFKPVMVDRVAKTAVWPNDALFLLMSGTVISPDMMAKELGWEGTYGYIQVPSSYPVKNRQVIVRPVADMSRKGQDEGGLDRVLTEIVRLVKEHEGRSVLVHAVSYQLARSIVERLSEGMVGRGIFHYKSAGERAEAIDAFKLHPGGVLVAPSAERGIDLPDDLCRVQIVAKVPFPYLGDQQVAARLHARNGSMWYQVQVARTVMQMVGRGVRHQEDWAFTYVLDAQFRRHWDAWSQLYPAWFRKAVRFEQERVG